MGDTRGLFTSGRCALSADWGGYRPAIDLKTSTVQDKVGAVIGARVQEGIRTGPAASWSTATPPGAHIAIDGVNHAPFSAFGGWSGAINAAVDQKVKDAAYAFLSYMSAPGAVQRRRHPRQDRVQPLPDLAVRGHRPVGQRA